MKTYLHITKIVAILFAFSTKVCSANQPSYQVSLYAHLHPQGTPIHVCNGVVVQSRLILTTATCVYYKFSSNNTLVIPLEPEMISVISGSSTAYHEELNLQVADIFIAGNFNYTTGENDLALLRLNGILPLDTRNDISWITLEDDNEYDDPCLASFFEQNSANGVPNFIQSEQLPVLDAESCKVASKHFIKREHDICSLYYLPTEFNCNAVETLQNYNSDRGTGLVCQNKLIGLLSDIFPWQNISECSEKPLRAYYTAVLPHINWIFNIISEEDLKMLNEGEYISSSPYAGETNAFIEPQVTETETPIVQTTAVHYQTTELSAHHNTATAPERRNCKLLFGTFAIIYLIAHSFSRCP